MSVTLEPARRVSLSLLIACILHTACASDSAEPAEPPPDRVPLGDGFLGAACDPCVAEFCAVELRNCEADPGCHALRLCRAACADAACDARCLAEQTPDAVAQKYLDSLALCAEYSCGRDCASAPAGDEDVAVCEQRFDESLGELSSPCAQQRECACRDCNREWLECLSDPDCTTRLDCALRRCDKGALPNDCYTECFFWAPETFLRAAFCAEHRCGRCLAGDGG